MDAPGNRNLMERNFMEATFEVYGLDEEAIPEYTDALMDED